MSYTILDLKQGSDEWLQARFNYITASNVPVIMGISPYSTPIELFEEKLLKVINPPKGEKEVLFAKGHAVEEKARDWLNKEFKEDYRPMVMASNTIPELMASLDGFNMRNNTILEVKYVGKDKLKEISKGNIPLDHGAQVQAQLLVSGASKCIYFASNGIDSCKQDVLPDPVQFEVIAKEVKAFAERLRTGEPPDLTDRDYLIVNDNSFSVLKDLKEQLDFAEKRFEAHKKSLVAKYAENPRVKCDGVSIVKALRKGTIQYKGIDLLKTIDLEVYRSKPSIITTVRFEKSTK